MTNEELVKVSMTMILHAGNGRAMITEALHAIEKDDEAVCQEKMAEARKEITLAHNAQTKVIQYSMENPLTINLLFTHAQDTLMTIESEYSLGKHLIKLYEKVNQLAGAKG